LLFAAFVLASPRASIVHHLDLIVVGADNSDALATVSIVRRIWQHAPIASLLFDEVAHRLLESPGQDNRQQRENNGRSMLGKDLLFSTVDSA
jgi:hypothetical protein